MDTIKTIIGKIEEETPMKELEGLDYKQYIEKLDDVSNVNPIFTTVENKTLPTEEEYIEKLINIVSNSNKLSLEEKKYIKYYLTDEDFINERFAIIDLTKTIIKLLGE